MNILITSNALDRPGGTEMFVRDLATHLARRGHRLQIYSTVLGRLAADLTRSGIRVTDDLSSIGEVPDVIHGQHFFEALAACLWFPDAPAIFTCHGWAPWQETPLTLSSIRRYVATGELTRARIIDCGVPAERVTIIPNGVDTGVFRARRPPDLKTGRVLLFGNGWREEGNTYRCIRKACEALGMVIETRGAGAGNPLHDPQDVLPLYDVVFALGRCALEAMACGCAVIIADHAGMYRLIDTHCFDNALINNFGLGLLNNRDVTTQLVAAELARIDARETSKVTDRVRARVNLEALINLWERQYRLAIEEGTCSLESLLASVPNALTPLRATLLNPPRMDPGSLQERIERSRQARPENRSEPGGGSSGNFPAHRSGDSANPSGTSPASCAEARRLAYLVTGRLTLTGRIQAALRRMDRAIARDGRLQRGGAREAAHRLAMAAASARRSLNGVLGWRNWRATVRLRHLMGVFRSRSRVR